MGVVVIESRRCDWHGGEPTRWLRRRRRNGSMHAYPIEFEQHCDREAIVTKRNDGRTVHRCLEHIR